jgi:nuclear protein localization family protein 4
MSRDDGSACVLSAGEVLYMASLQNKYPNAVLPKFSSAGQFGSKFVTVVVSGDKDSAISLKAYQTTNQAMALTRGTQPALFCFFSLYL